jgi:1,2-diacylglycerol 3-beta-galactosyltransferase
VPCQEEGNIPYVVENRCGAFERDPDKIAAILDRWFSPSGAGELAAMSANARALGRPDALHRIVRDLAALAEEHAAAMGGASRERGSTATAVQQLPRGALVAA